MPMPRCGADPTPNLHSARKLRSSTPRGAGQTPRPALINALRHAAAPHGIFIPETPRGLYPSQYPDESALLHPVTATASCFLPITSHPTLGGDG